jgi:acyl transferase domain-containing protein/acyl carrier protein
MTDESSQNSPSSVRGAPQSAQVLAALREARSRIESLERSRREPIAIVGAACRLPGASDTPEAFWNLLAARRDAITPVPANRWQNADYFSADPDAPGTLNVSGGGFIELQQDFDPEFFGMAPREALSLDPQQRLLLEVSWEALENAGMAADRLNGQEIGVFTAICWNDYGQRLLGRDAREIDAYMASGIANSMAAGRLSYILGLHGPSITIDTACSSSLVAVHLACQSLRNGECAAAIVGGASQLLHPELYVNFTKAHMLSPDNRCKTFDAGANGFVRSEGCVVVVLKRLSDALAANDEVLAVIRGSAINHDGHTSGLTVPNGPAQQDVIRKALRAADLSPDEIDYIEAHGTGTALGDPIEVGALGAVFGRAARRAPLVLGAVKSNIGHLEAAAGLAGLLKVVLALRHESIPANLHFSNPNPHIDWQRLPFAVPVREHAWPRSERARVAGVSSFGFSGTNAHVIVAEAPQPVRAPSSAERPVHVLTLSARSENALRTLAARYAQRLSDDGQIELADAAFTANTGRAQFLHRLAVCAKSAAEATAALNAAARGEASPAVVRGRVERGGRPRIAFLFTGQGSQYVGMGRALYETQPTFKAALDECDRILSERHGVALLDSLYRGGADLNATQITQPALFAIEYALSRLWMSWGVEPTHLMGHSVGEYVAACVAGVFSLEEGLMLIAARGRLMGALPSNGAMAAILTDEAAVAAALAPHAREAAIAAVNGPTNVVISGDRAVVERLCTQFTARGIRTVPLVVSHAFHSPLVEPMLDEFRRVAERITYSKPRREVISNVTGAVAGAEIASADYWCRHVRAPVRFAAGMQALHARGCNSFIEVGPRPVLLGMGRQCVPEGGAWLPSLRPDTDDWSVLLSSVGTLYVQGVPIDWIGFDRDYTRKRVPLPNYPFERRRYWIDATVRSQAAATAQGDTVGLLGSRLSLATSETVYSSRVSAERPAYLADHVVGGRTLMPAAAFLEMALTAARITTSAGEGPIAVEDVVIAAPLVLHERTPTEVQFVIAPGAPNAFRISSRAQADESWTLHVSGRLASVSTEQAPEPLDIGAARAAAARVFESRDYYERARSAGFEFGPAFRGLQQLWAGEQVALGEIMLPESLGRQDGASAFHPALLDACLQVVASFVPAGRELVVPLGISRIIVFRKPSTHLFSRATLRGAVSESGALAADVAIFDAAGQPVAQIEGFACRPLASVGRASDVAEYDLVWRLAPRVLKEPPRASGHWLIVADELGYADALAKALQELGARTLLARAGTAFRRLDQAHCELDLSDRAQLEQLLQLGGAQWQGIVHCGAVCGDSVADAMTVEQLERSQTLGCASLLALVQAMIATEASANARLVVVTRGVHSVSTEPLHPLGIAGATAWGLARVIASEHPHTGCVRVDLDPHGAPEAHAPALAAEVLTAESGEEVALRAGGLRYVGRLSTHEARATRTEVPTGVARLEASRAGVLDELKWVSHVRRAPAPHEVEIEIRATGLGFRDVLNSLGMYPGGPVPLGCECAGVITAVGSAVSHVAVGDAVFGVAYGSFATHVTVPGAWVVRKPPTLSFEQAAAIPSSFLTAEYSLLTVAKLTQGQRVLIHAGAGGVGNAAIQVALHAGAEVFATAGSPAKRAFLASIGVHHTYDSRSTEFADEILRATGGRGVDVVLNSLADEFIERSFAVLAAEGCFVELGKRGILTAEHARQLRPRARYVIVDLGEVSPQQPALVHEMLTRIVERLEQGMYAPPPVTSFAMDRATEAFQHMARARHTGKIVTTASPARTRDVVRSDGTYIVTGGLGALGLEVARSLVGRGARHIVLVGRRPPADDVAAVIAQLRQQASDVRVVAADVADYDALAAALDDLRKEMPPIRGIVHAAGVLDDGVIAQQTWVRCAQVLAPKVRGAWNLHQLTQQDSLDFFVLFSAAAGLLGIPGQGTYAAANVFLDSLAVFRRRMGLPATSIDWGAWDQRGMAQSLDAVRSLAARGLRFMSVTRGIEALWQAIADDAAQRIVLPIDWQRFRERAGDAPMPLLSECFAEEGRRAASAPAAPKTTTSRQPQPSADLATRLAQAPAPARYRMLADLVLAQVRSTIGLAPDQAVDERQPLQELGLDSLMAVELRNALAAMTARTLPATLAFDYPTTEAISRHLLSVLMPEHSTPAAPAVRKHVQSVGRVTDADVAALSDDEAAELLLQELDEVARQ